jgi:septal ring factor EnvC (AmiA/AmiB activator)
VVLSASGSTVASVAAGAILPAWFLKHLGLLVFVDE